MKFFYCISTPDSDRSITCYTCRPGESTIVSDCSPSLSFMKGWTRTEVHQYCALEGWNITEITVYENET